MKLKGKLILSCAALAAVATTAFSTTYAWYTANSTVTANGISASTAQAASDALQISLDGNTWSASVDLTSKLTGKTALVPVERTAVDKSVGTYKTWDPNNNAPKDAAIDTPVGSVVQFDLYFRNIGVASSSVQVSGAAIANVSKVSAAENAAAGLPTQKLLSDIGSYTTAANPTYTVDILRALDLEIAIQTIVIDEGKVVSVSSLTGENANSVTTWTSANTLDYSLHGSHDKTSVYKDTLDEDAASGYNAHTYYNAVKGANITTTGAAEGTNFAPSNDAMIKLSDTTGQTIVKTTWTIYLNGWNKACFDACKGQNITMSLTFNAVAPQQNQGGQGGQGA